ncbi:hypothetical protein ACH5BF_11045 [Arcobacter sp. YIC-464]|uniref:hypothetical protein n=1 Tax=Arcobacter sp. YIC-464 TaxID=3376631 RepID=UPI003C21D36F
MKKSIVLLVSLLFITAISTLILKNLDDTNEYISEQNYKLNQSQLLMMINNAKNEASKFIEKYPDDLKALENIPFTLKDVELQLSLIEYDKYDLNLLRENDIEKYKSIQEFFWDNSVDGFENLQYLLKGSEPISNSKQLDDIITTFIKQIYSDDILKIKDSLGFIKAPDDSKLYELKIRVNYLKQMAKAYYILDKDGKVKYFELSFK